jgi:RHS repeat-associated protein
LTARISNRLTEVRNQDSGALLEGSTWDPFGNRRTRTTGAATLAYSYDAAHQLADIREGSPAGPLVAAFVYDAAGNLTRQCEGGSVTGTTSTCTGATVAELTYDAANRLTALTKTGLPAEHYAYDGEGRRIRKTVDATATDYRYDGPDIVGEHPGWAGQPTVYLHGPGMDDPLIRWTPATSSAESYHQDGLGSVVAMTNQAGEITATARYDAWGNTLASTGTIPRYGYTGREPDATGLIYYRARYYDPTVGRFTQRDPIGMQGGLNPYAYVGGNPVNFTDPLGLRPPEPLDVQLLEATLPVLALLGKIPGPTYFAQPTDTAAAASAPGEAPAGPLLAAGPITDAVASDAPSFFEAILPKGGGVVGSGSAEAGLLMGGAVTGSAGWGVFGGGPKGLSTGGFATFGGFLGGPGFGPRYPSGDSLNVVGGAFAGGGAGVFITNATSPTGLADAFKTYSFNLGIGPKLSIQLGISGTTWIFSITVGPGYGVSGSGYSTNTWTTK